MSKKLVLAATTAAFALSLTAPDLAGAQSAQPPAPSNQLRAPEQRPVKPAPGTVDGLGSIFIDLAGETLYPKLQEGQPGSHFCGSTPTGARSDNVAIVVRNKGNPLASQVKVSFTFSTGQFLTTTIPLIKAGAAKGASVAIPKGAWKNGKAQFHISIDPTNAIGESNETNNSFHSFCVDPNA